MVTYETKIKIDRPIEEVYRVMSDQSKSTKWLTGLKEVKPITENGSMMEKGAKSQYIFMERGKEIMFEEELLDIHPPSKFSYRLESAQVTVNAETHLKQLNGRTEVLIINGVKGKGFMMKIFMPFFKATMIKRQNGDLQNLKKLIEETN